MFKRVLCLKQILAQTAMLVSSLHRNSAKLLSLTHGQIDAIWVVGRRCSLVLLMTAPDVSMC